VQTAEDRQPSAVGDLATQVIEACRGVMLCGQQLQQRQIDAGPGMEQLITQASSAYCAALAMKDARMNQILRDMHTQVTAVQMAAQRSEPLSAETIASAAHHVPLLARQLFDAVNASCQ